MGGNIPGGNFLGGNFPGRNFPRTIVAYTLRYKIKFSHQIEKDTLTIITQPTSPVLLRVFPISARYVDWWLALVSGPGMLNNFALTNPFIFADLLMQFFNSVNQKCFAHVSIYWFLTSYLTKKNVALKSEQFSPFLLFDTTNRYWAPNEH